MPFVQMIREKTDIVGKGAMALTWDFDEKEILDNNLEYLKNTLDVSQRFYLLTVTNLLTIFFLAQLESLEIKFTDSLDAPEKTREEVRPGTPYINFFSKPMVVISLENPIERSGFFSLKAGIGNNDTTKQFREKIAKIIGLKDLKALTLWRYEDSVLGPRKIPAFKDYEAGKVILEEGIFEIDVSKNEVKLAVIGKKIDVGTNLIYVIA